MSSRLKRYKVEDNVEDYIISKNNPTLKKKSWPLLEFPQIERERQRRQLVEVEGQLKMKRKYYTEQRKVMIKQWKEIEREGQTLKENFISFNEFLCVNMEKRNRAEVNLAESKKLREHTEKDIEELLTKLMDLKKTKEDLDNKIRDHIIYEQYLSEVLSVCLKDENFRNESDFVRRYEYYAELNRELAKKQEKIFTDLQEIKIEMSKFTEKAENILMGLKFQSVTLQGRYEETSRKARRMETLVCRIKDKIIQKDSDVNLVKSATWNLYRLICRKKNITPKISKNNIEDQLLFIKHTLRQIHIITEELTLRQ
ncbi:girdin-like, partial [Asbolus verrucosus]